jgi:pilus assembly protein CpaB
MAVRIALFLLILVGLAGIGVTMAIGLRPPVVPTQVAAPQEVVVPKAQIISAARVVRAGTLLLPDDVASKAVVAAEVPVGAWIDNMDTRAAIQGAMVRHQIEPGQPILHEDIVRPSERGFLAAVLSPGTRAATIGVDAVSGTAGLIWPGDRVDVILTQKLDDDKAPAGRRVAGETVIQNARVIAVDQHMVEGVSPNGGLGPTNTVARTITIEVQARDAERLSVAATLGHLAVVIRSAADPAPATAEEHAAAQEKVGDSLVWSSDVSAAYRPSIRNAETTVHLFIGPQANPVEYHY